MKRSIKEVIGIDSANAYKPVFLTKIQRQELALNRHRDQISDNRLRRDQIGDFITDSEYANVDRIKDRERDLDRDRHRDRNRDRRERDREPDRRIRDRNRNSRERDREPDSRIRYRNLDRRERDREPVLRIREEAKAREKKRIERLFEREQDKQLDAMKEFLCRESTKPKKRVIKPSEKFRYSFHWENTEDTSGDTYALCQNPHEARILFGAGMDRIDQKKQAAKHEKDTLRMKDYKHWSEKRLEEMSERDWRIFKEDFNISYKGTKIPRPMRNWKESKLGSELLRAVERAGYEKPSPIQMAAIPLGLQQRDVIGIAETGSGKTDAFVLPMLAYIARLPPMSEENEREGPYAVVIAPTRELALQIEEETAKFARYLGFRVTSIVGGQCIEKQGLKITQGCEIVIATPGRLIDCLERRYVVLNQCNYVVLDEADRMIDLGFEPQVADVLDAMPSSNLKPENEEEELDEKKIYRTTYMFSATMSPGLERLARKYLRNPVVITTVTEGKTTDTITQQVIMMEESEKLFRLQKLLDELGDKTAIVFVNTKKNVDFVANKLDNAGYRVTTIHGGKSQDQREISLGGFKEKRYNVLVATDVVGRGIDISDVAHVINYDMPKDIETYTHRIGRTGRAGKSGVATSFLTLQDTEAFDDLKQMLVLSNSVVPPELARASGFKPGPVPDRRPRHSDTIHRN